MTKISNLIWTYSWDVPSGNDGTQAVSITATDNAGNTNDAATGVTSYTIDNTAPSVDLSYNPNRDVKDIDFLTITATFDEAPNNTPTIAIDTQLTDLSTINMSGSGTVWTYSYNTPSSSDGIATVTIAAQDTAGNNSNAATNPTFNIDNTAPAASEIIPISTATNDSTPDIGINVESGVGFEIKNGATTVASGTGTGATQIITLSSLVAGTYDLDLIATDNALNQTTADLTQFTIDFTAPTVELSSNQIDTIVRDSDTVLIAATFTDLSGMNELVVPKITISGLIVNQDMTMTSNLVWTYSWNVPSGNDGSYSISISALDNALNFNDPATGQTSFTIDNTAANIALTYDLSRDVKDTDPLLITATFDEAPSNTPTIDINTTGFSTTDMSGSNLIWTYSYDVPSGNDGAAYVTITSTDIAGNPNNTATNPNFTIDNTAPTATETNAIITPTNDTTPNISVNVENGINFEIKNGSTVLASNTGTGNSQTLTLTTLEEGTYNLDLIATDNAENITSTDLTQFIVDLTNPTVILSDDQIDQIVRDNNTVIITATFTESNDINETAIPKISIGNLITNANMTKTSNLVWTYPWDVPSGNDGTVAISIIAYDSANNSNDAATGATSYTIDNTAPDVAITYSPDRDVANIDPLTITATFTEPPALTPTINIDTTGFTTQDMTGSENTWTYEYDVPSDNDGTANINISAYDSAGNTNNNATNASFTIDNIAPTLNIISGTDTGPTQSDTINIIIDESNTISVAEYGFSEDNTCDATDTYGNSFTSGDDFLIGGTHTNYLCVITTDSAQNSTYQYIGQLNTDNIAPTLNYAVISSNNASTSLAMANNIITLNIISDKNIATPTIEIAGSAADSITQGIDAKNWTAISSLSSNDTEGLITFNINFNDTIGNVGNEVTQTTDNSTVTLDTTSPTATINDKPAISTQEKTANISIGGTDVEYYKYKLDNGSYNAETITSSNINLTGLSSGSHIIYILARDAAGNWQTSSTNYNWTITQPVSSGGGGGYSYQPPAPPSTYQNYNPGTGQTTLEPLETEEPEKETPSTIIEKIQTTSISNDGTEISKETQELTERGITTEVVVETTIKPAVNPKDTQTINLTPPMHSSIKTINLNLSKNILKELISNHSSNADINVNIGYKQATSAHIGSSALGSGNILVDDNIFSIDLSVDNQEITSFDNPLELNFDVSKLDNKEELAVAWFDPVLRKWIEIDTQINGNKLIISITHLTDFAIIRKIAIASIKTEPQPISAPAPITGRLITINNDANAIESGGDALLANTESIRNISAEKQVSDKYTKSLLANIKGFVKDAVYKITNFITYGTKTTQKLGQGERASVLSSYKEAFEKLPNKKDEWIDVLKISNGRWPTETNLKAEERAQIQFAKIYKRSPNMDNPKDVAAINIMTYGIRSSQRNTNSEISAINAFKSIYKKAPSNNSEWNIVRAIAYSGASREDVLARQETKPTTKIDTTNLCITENKFSWYLRQGSSGGRVGDLQKLLKCLGHFPSSVEVSNLYGPITTNAVKSFQKDKGLQAVGYVGRRTRDALNYYLKANLPQRLKDISPEEVKKTTEAVIIPKEQKEETTQTPITKTAKQKELEAKKLTCTIHKKFTKELKTGYIGADAKQLQYLLRCLGYFPENFNPVVYYGTKTTNAVKAFQKDMDLETVGYLGSKTRNTLNSYYKPKTETSTTPQAIPTTPVATKKQEITKPEPVKKQETTKSEPTTQQSIDDLFGELAGKPSQVTEKLKQVKENEALYTQKEATQASCGVDKGFKYKQEKGDSGSSVKKLQSLLQCLEYFPTDVPTSTNFGPTTEEALKKFQQDKGLTPVGFIGSQTLRELNKYEQ